MKTYLNMPTEHFLSIREHLLPQNSENEQAVFLVGKVTRGNERCDIEVQDIIKLHEKNLDAQSEGYLEMGDETRSNLIKRAHDLQGCLVEAHSHPGPWPAAFSHFDQSGLAETVPNIMWRLKGQPYVALVFAPSGFDALVWHRRGASAEKLTGLVTGNQVWAPTNNTKDLAR